MRIPGVEGKLNTAQELTVAPKIIELLHKLSQQPLRIEKLLLDQQPFIQLSLSKNPFLKQLNIPNSLSQAISSITHDKVSLQFKLSKSNIEISLQPVNNTIKQEKHSAINLLFKHAKLISPKTLELSRPVQGQQFPAGSNTVKPQHTDTQYTATSVKNSPKTPTPENVNSSHTEKSKLSLPQAISFFLKSKPIETVPVSRSLNNIFTKFDRFIDSISYQGLNRSNSPLPLNLTSNLTAEILLKAAHNNPENTLLNHFSKVAQQINELKNLLDFSKKNSQLQIKQRIFQSGHFLESKLTTSKQPIPTESQTSEKKLNQQTSNTQILSNKKNQNQLNTLLQASPLSKENPAQQKDQSLKKEVKQITSPQQNIIPKDLKLMVLSLKENLNNLRTIQNQSTIKTIALPQILNELSQLISSAENSPIKRSDNSLPVSTTLGKTSINKIPDLLKTNSSIEFNKLIQDPQLAAKINQFKLSPKQLEQFTQIQTRIIAELLTETNAVINRVETNQLISARSEAAHLQQFLLDVPIFHRNNIDSFELLFENKNNDKQGTKKCWVVTVKFDLKPLGPMFARVSLQNNRISTHFFAESSDTTKLLTENLPHLERSLFLAGVEVNEISGQQGIVPKELVANTEHSVDIKV